jgi:hypothetical protein
VPKSTSLSRQPRATSFGVKVKNPKAPAVTREAEEDRGPLIGSRPRSKYGNLSVV